MRWMISDSAPELVQQFEVAADIPRLVVVPYLTVMAAAELHSTSTSTLVVLSPSSQGPTITAASACNRPANSQTMRGRPANAKRAPCRAIVHFITRYWELNPRKMQSFSGPLRSEEHTSELQSL